MSQAIGWKENVTVFCPVASMNMESGNNGNMRRWHTRLMNASACPAGKEQRSRE
jgi:hypothetical protein